MACFNASLESLKRLSDGRLFLKLFVCTIMSLVTIATITGNILVIASVINFRRLRSRICFHLLASLASADIAIAILVMPYSTLYHMLGCWPLGDAFCKFYLSSDIMCCTSSILHLCLISLDRYIAVTNPLHYKALVRPRRIWTMVAAVWIISVGLSFGPVFSGSFGLTLPDRNATVAASTTAQASCRMDVNQVYAVVSALTSFFLPLVVMTIAYVRVHRIATAHTESVRRRKAIASLSRSSGDQSATGGVRSLVPQSLRMSNSETKATKTLGLILGCFYACWLPFFLLYVACPFVSDRCASLPTWLMPLVTWIGYANSGVNPVVYCSNQREFRLAYLRLLGCRKESDLQYLRSERNTISLCRRANDYQLSSQLSNNVQARIERVVNPRAGENCLGLSDGRSLGDMPLTDIVCNDPEVEMSQSEQSSSVHQFKDGEV